MRIDAVESCGLKDSRLRQVAGDRRLRLTCTQMKNVLFDDPTSAEATGVGIVADLEDMTPDVASMRVQEAFDVVTIDRCSARVPEMPAQRIGTARPANRHGEAAVRSAKRHRYPLQKTAVDHPPPRSFR